MRVLALLAHPSPASFNHAIFDTAVEALRANGHHVDAIDLYAIGFDPVMSREDRAAYDTDAPLRSPISAAHADLVRHADMLLFVYPTWWSGVPAILKGWLDKTLVQGVAFRFEGQRVKRGMRHVRRIVGISTYGSSKWTVRLVNDNGRRTLTRALRLCTSMRTRSNWYGLYGLADSTPAQREAFLQHVAAKMAAL
jgi:NAD(P)H dehydrogenase (quinone)